MATKTKLNIKELNEKGKKIYEEELKNRLEGKYDNKLVAIEVNSGKYYIADRPLDAIHKAQKDFPDEIFYIARVGSPYVYTL
ncbi:hypothetical protein A2897_01415 [Candidatus Woesebacteria bacterium RIFCSPLOWO2_01_FULL_44_24b]|nr:MAG: hypothetical protein A2897_01415 [Candidatus Woesebacteria bacterium RIFCSPLOWO2_01_FULL_44_24b]